MDWWALGCVIWQLHVSGTKELFPAKSTDADDDNARNRNAGALDPLRRILAVVGQPDWFRGLSCRCRICPAMPQPPVTNDALVAALPTPDGNIAKLLVRLLSANAYDRVPPPPFMFSNGGDVGSLTDRA